jgi:multidrug efflux pump subunit AcrA (membrane-fusion protein)
MSKTTSSPLEGPPLVKAGAAPAAASELPSQPRAVGPRAFSNDRRSIRRRLRLLPMLVTLVVASVGAGAAWLLWQNYMGTPWTRDGTVRTNVVTLAPDLAGQVVQLAVRDNQFVQRTALARLS